MNKQDLMKMADYAAEITAAARKHEAALRWAVDNWDSLPDHSDYAVLGESFEPLSRALAEWRCLMAAIFPPVIPESQDIEL